MEHDKLARKQGKTYVSSSGADIKAAKKAVQASMRKGRNKQVDINGGVYKVCKYYPYFCHVVGHSTAASKECYMNRKTKLEKDEATQKIEETLIRKYMKKQSR